MRIISGTWRSRPLVAPKGDTTRPTADRTRETLFSMLTSRLGSFEELAVLDLFAGSGALRFGGTVARCRDLHLSSNMIAAALKALDKQYRQAWRQGAIRRAPLVGAVARQRD